jgi:hypothetical protein
VHRQNPYDLPLAQFALARALRVAGQDPARARALAESAREALAQSPGKQKELAAVDAWLSDRTAARGAGRSLP